jgi:predicted ATP-dependent endonuclease of OLD family
MVDKKKITEHYNEVRSSLDMAITDVFDTKIEGDSEKVMIENLEKNLGEINKTFKNEIDALENDSEWNKFCIAFFGETNSGKSTLIDALRIVFKEETRTQELEKNKKHFEEAFVENNKAYLEANRYIIQFKNGVMQYLQQQQEKDRKQVQIINKLQDENVKLREVSTGLQENINNYKNIIGSLKNNIKDLDLKGVEQNQNIVILQKRLDKQRNISLIIGIILVIISFLIGKYF